MFGFLRRKKPPAPTPAPETPAAPPVESSAPPAAPEPVPAPGPAAPDARPPDPVPTPAAPRAPSATPAPEPASGPTPFPATAPSPAQVASSPPQPASAPTPSSTAAPSSTFASTPARAFAPAPAVPASSTVDQATGQPAAAQPSPAPAAFAPPPSSPAPAPAAPTVADQPDADAAPVEQAAPEGYELAPAPAERTGWMARLKQGLGKTRGNIAGLFGLTKIDEALFEDLETALLTSDAGFEATERLLKDLRARIKSQRLTSGEQVRQALRELIAETLRPLERPMDIDEARPLVMMIAGVNGAGKTTSIGKLAHHLQREGKSILLAAGDTFRAAAREQLATWGARNDVQVIAQQGGDPAAVAFDAVSAGLARSTGVVMIDTAGRLPTQTHLMDELKKVKRVLGKAMAGAPHQTLLILDGNTGQNMLTQVKAFDEAVGLTGLIVTKLDGTAKGGALIGLAWQQRDKPIPVYFIGVGEGIDDLQAFSAAEFAEAVTGA
ncbi:MAG: signal recognition particle-docking protein FtsY [Burkholderiaceae bacterium]